MERRTGVEDGPNRLLVVVLMRHVEPPARQDRVVVDVEPRRRVALVGAPEPVRHHR
jgi:hypothetical protein